ncbi:methylated-DNA--[protein]-cysteine S-methyltransferase [Marinigracilibium pacificum]|uniref:Methylated-DNA--protein-cysteine methyltransferase n=1 Tax=Marinigracilibium pacificum TaxID=2729599 RepID=A0A848IT23_9BACT|nr:methylated-DNA--[protein]-cysteine S-methyltransferase [Marinigracilibium pacificum]NMM47487.1 methylated-DNA--[protein]-cysteine S-methyltransferase [Marinigracilibium pacificum]
MIQTITYKSPYGELVIGSYKDNLVLCDWKYRRMRESIDNRIKNYFSVEFIQESSEICELTITQLEEYFKGTRKEFNIPISMAGSAFQQEVWKELIKIPYGKTTSYLELSKKLNNPGAIRAIGSANGANAIAIIIPCHRVIGSDGDLTGYAGGLNTKKSLLKLENAPVVSSQQELF